LIAQPVLGRALCQFVRLQVGVDGRLADELGGEGDDFVGASAGQDFLDGGNGDDTLRDSGNGNDTLLGGNGDDTISNIGGQDYLDGGDGADSLVGGAGNDSLVGGSGNDTLAGGFGNDTIEGGEGNDVFLYSVTVFLGEDTFFDNPAAGDADVVLGIEAGEVLDINITPADVLTVGGSVIGDGDTLGDTIDNGNNIAFDDASDLLMIDLNSDGAFVAGDDLSIELIGVATVTYNAGDSSFFFTLDSP